MALAISEVEQMKVIAQYALTKGIVVEDEVRQHIPEYADLAPQAVCDAEGAETPVEKAYIAARVALGGGGSAATPATQTTAVQTAPTQIVSAAEASGIINLVKQQDEERTAVSLNTEIEKLILNTPDPATYIKAGTTGTIKKETWEALEAKYKDAVQPDDNDVASQANFAALKQAAENGTPVEVHIPKLNDKVYGYLVKKGTATSKGTEITQETRESFAAFLALEARGYVLNAGPNKPGCILKYIEEHPDKKRPGKQIPARWSLSDRGKKEAIQAGSYDTLKEVTQKTKEQNAKSELAFKVDSGKPRQNGAGNIIRTVRVTVQAVLPELALKDAYAKNFASVGAGRSGALETVPTGEAFNNVETAQMMAIADLRAKAADPKTMSSVSNYAEKLQAFSNVGASTPAPNVAI